MLRLVDILSQDRVLVDVRGSEFTDKRSVMGALAKLLSPTSGSDRESVERLLLEREALRSTGIGDGVAIPHCFVDTASEQRAALLLCPNGVEFDAIDKKPVNIVVGVVGPKRATEHLRVLARVSRVLHDTDVRARLVNSADAEQAYALIQSRDQSLT
ncbi:MAG: PTS sugar transporter subunit IIA [Myxococcales bacterium]|nr:PTS sugar transporter subunit IIA [Myxococcales bacterium]